MVRRLLAFFVCIVVVAFVAGCGSRKNDGTGGSPAPTGDAWGNVRIPAGSLYPSVGEIKKNGAHLCSGVILSHGLFASAKHCFRDYAGTADVPNYSLHFSTTGIIDSAALSVPGTALTAIDADDASNDIAYIHYAKEDTDGKITIDCPTIASTPPAAGVKVQLIGYPTPIDEVMRRLISENCETTGRTGYLPPMETDPGYSGLLYDTNCGAWFGNSGGPIYAVDDNGQPTALLGVVTHTFDLLLPSGNLDTAKEGSDAYGTHVTTTNMSSFSLTKKLPAG